MDTHAVTKSSTILCLLLLHSGSAVTIAFGAELVMRNGDIPRNGRTCAAAKIDSIGLGILIPEGVRRWSVHAVNPIILHGKVLSTGRHLYKATASASHSRLLSVPLQVLYGLKITATSSGLQRLTNKAHGTLEYGSLVVRLTVGHDWATERHVAREGEVAGKGAIVAGAEVYRAAASAGAGVDGGDYLRLGHPGGYSSAAGMGASTEQKKHDSRH
jgi:hypothetical protein